MAGVSANADRGYPRRLIPSDGCTGLDYLRFILRNARFLGFGVLLAGLSSVGQTFVISLFGGHLREEFDLSNADFGLLYGLATVASAVSLIWIGRLVDSVDLRVLTTGVLTTAGLGCLLLAGSQGIGVLALAFFMLRLSGQGMMVHIAQTSMARYFTTARGKAISIAMLGLPLAEGIVPLIMVNSASVLGWRETWLITATVVAAVMMPAALTLLRGHQQRQAAYAARLADTDDNDRMRDWRRGEVLRHPFFYAMLPAIMAPPFIITALFFHQVPLAEEQGWSLRWLAFSFLGFASAHVLSLLLTGPLVDRFGARRLVPVYLLPMTTGLALLAMATGPWVAPAYLILAGLSVGAAGTLMGALWAELYGTRHLGAIRAVVQAIMVMMTALSPVLAGLLLDAGARPSGVAQLFAVYAVLASLLAAVAVTRVAPRR